MWGIPSIKESYSSNNIPDEKEESYPEGGIQMQKDKLDSS